MGRGAGSMDGVRRVRGGMLLMVGEAKREEGRGPAGENAGSAGDRFRGVAYNWRLATFLLRGRTGVVGGGCCWLGGDKSVVFRVGLLTATTTTQRARCC